jgi:SNF2 family DNA or RNA helicase
MIRSFELHPLEDGAPVESVLKVNVVVSNYEQLNTDTEFFEDVRWRYAVFDEGHRLKSHSTRTYAQAKQGASGPFHDSDGNAHPG